MLTFWPHSGLALLERNAQGWLRTTDAYWRSFFARPELELLPQSCPAERRLHASLQAQPQRSVTAQDIAALKDPDARESYTLFMRFRDGLLRAGTLEAYYAQLMRSGAVNIPPLLIDAVVQAIVHHLLLQSFSAGDTTEGAAHGKVDSTAQQAITVRAAELLFRAQRVAVSDGRIVAGDQEALDNAQATGGVGDLGRLLLQNKVQLSEAQMQVVSSQQQDKFWTSAAKASYHHQWLLDMTHETTNAVGQGQHTFTIQLARTDSGLTALARVLSLWIAHFHGTQVRIQPLSKVEDAAWRWHIGLDVEASSLLNDLYNQQPIDDTRMRRLISLFRLEFVNPAEMRADMQGKPVYLGLAMTAQGLLRVKPQNLLLNLPVAVAS